MQKSKKLAAEETISNAQEFDSTLGLNTLAPSKNGDNVVKIKELKCANEYVAILRSQHQSEIHLTNDAQYKNEGIVVGVGPGEALAGGRIGSQFKVGDYVMFLEKYIFLQIVGSLPPYTGKMIVYVSERNIVSHLPSIPFEIVK